MKNSILSVLLLAISFGSMAQKNPKTPVTKTLKVSTIPVKLTPNPPMKSLLDSFSYMAGYNVANNMMQQGITNVNAELLKRGIEDYFGNKQPLLVPQEGNKSLQRQLDIFAQKKAVIEKIKTDADKAKGVAFLENNKKRQGVITLPSGLQYEIVKQADSIAHKPVFSDTVVVNYIGAFIDGTEFNNSYKAGKPIIFPLAPTGMIKGWIEILQLMPVGSHWKVYVPTDLAYGDNPPQGSGIAPGAPLVFDILLEGIKPATKQ